MSFPNQAPNGIYLTNDEILEGEKNGTIIGVFSVSDPNPNSFHTIHLLDQNHSISPKPFFIDENNSLRTSSILDFEKNQKIQIKVRATDEGNLSFEKSFTIKIKNLNEDMDQDGIEDAFDDDMDGDGFSNEEEISFGSDPSNPESLVNRSPSDLFLSDSTFLENLPAGTHVGNFLGLDPDKNSTLRYELVDGNGSLNNKHFLVKQDGTLLTNRIFDYENKPNLSVRVRVIDGFDAHLDKIFFLQVEDVFEEPIDRLPIVYTEDALKGKDNQFQLNGSIVERGDFETEETGFIFHIDGKEPESISAKTDPQNLAFKLNIEVTAGENHYFQAYAKTAFGTAYGAIKKFIITDTNKSKAWWNELSPKKVDGWLTDSWIGELMPFENQWAFHLRLQWIYLQSDGNEGFWIWKEENGWIWTNSESWPFLWSNETGNWLYFIPLDSGYIFYDYSESRLQ
jgi:hypothetical protein